MDAEDGAVAASAAAAGLGMPQEPPGSARPPLPPVVTGAGALAAGVGLPYATSAGLGGAAAGALFAAAGQPSQGTGTAFPFPAPPPPPFHGTRPDSALAAALVAARAAAAEGQARVRAAALAWEHKRDAADALARQITEAERLLISPASHDAGATFSDSSGRRVSHPTVIWHDPADPLVAQLHYQTGGVQNIRLLVLVVLEPESPSYAHVLSVSH
jgi:hypothetical protein